MLTFISVIVVICFFSLCICDDEDCPNGFTRHRGSCYHAVRIQATWGEAEIYCHAAGAELAWIESKEENHYIAGLLTNLAASYGDVYWVSGNDIREEGTWVWGSSDEVIGLDQVFTNWHPGQPDNVHTHGTENCMDVSRGFQWQWNDSNCDRKSSFVCKKRLSFGNPGVIG